MKTSAIPTSVNSFRVSAKLREAKNHINGIRRCYQVRKKLDQRDITPWEFLIQMLCSAYFSWRWLDAKFKPWSLSYWYWLASYSSIHELATRAQLARDRICRERPRLTEL